MSEGQSSVVRGVREGRGGKVGREFSFLTAWWMKLSFSLLVLAWRLRSLLPDGRRLKKLCDGWVGSNAEGFAGETGAVDVLEGGERDTNNLLSCSHYPLKWLAAGCVAGAVPHSNAASQDALDGASVEGAHDGGWSSGSSEFAEEVEMLLCFLGQCCSVVSPGEVLCDVHTQELGAAHSLHSRTVDGQRSMLCVHSPEVNNNLLHLLHIPREIVVTAPHSQAAHLAPVVCLISVADETHHSRVIRKFNEEVGVVWRCAVMGQQSEEEGAQHTSLGGGAVFSVMVLDVLLPTRTAWGLLVRKSNSQLHSDVLSPSWTNLWMSCWGMIVLNAELKSMNSILTYKSFLSRVWGLGGGQWRWHHRSSGWTYMQTGRGPGSGGRTDLMWCMTKPFKALHENRSECYWTVVIEAGWRWLLRDWNDGGSFQCSQSQTYLLISGTQWPIRDIYVRHYPLTA